MEMGVCNMADGDLLINGVQVFVIRHVLAKEDPARRGSPEANSRACGADHLGRDGQAVKGSGAYASSMSASPSPTSLHSRLRSVSRLTPPTREAHRLSAGVRNVYPLWLLMTPIACRTAFRLSRPKTAGSPIHSRLASSSVSRAESAAVSMPGAAVNVEVDVSERGGEG